MSEKLNPRFANYVTSTAFNLTLRKTHIYALVYAANSDTAYGAKQRFSCTKPSYDTVVSGLKDLCERGLIVHRWTEGIKLAELKGPAYTLTEAGVLVLKLLVMAGLVEDMDASSAIKVYKGKRTRARVNSR